MTSTLIATELTADGAVRPVSPTNPVPVAMVAPQTAGTGGLSLYSNLALAATKAVVKAGPASLGGLHIHNPNAAITYIQFFNKLTADVTVGTTTPDLVLGIAANGAVTLPLSIPANFTVGMVVAATTTTTGLTAPGTGVVVALFYN